VITAIVSSVLGMVGGLLPEAVKEFRDTRAHTREREFLTLTHNFQLEREKLNMEGKMREAEAGLLAAEMAATREHLTAIIEAQAKPTGILWIDAANSIVRPACALAIFAMFIASVSAYSLGISAVNPEFGAQMGSLFAASVEAVLGFFFGYRSMARRR